MGTGDFIVLVLAGVGGGALFVAFVDLAVMDADWCAGSTQCLRDWISALSGWAAAIAAAITIVFLAGQMREARRQTEYLVGDANPTIAMTDPQNIRDPSEAFQNLLIITNWNRNPIVIHEIDIVDENVLVEVDVHLDDRAPATRNFLRSQFEQKKLFIAGWDDRNIPPPRIGFLLAIGRYDDGPATEKDWSVVRRGYVSLTVDLTVLASTPRRLKLDLTSPHGIIL